MGASDEDLMLRYRDGEAAAFEALYARHRGRLFRYLLRNCSDPRASEEMFQDVWLKVIAARARYEPRARFTTWLYTIAHNRLVDHYRRGASTPEPAEPEALEALEARASDGPEARADVERRLARLRELLAELPEVQREAFLLRQEAGLSIEAIAEATGVGAETAKSRLRYAMAKLRAGLTR